MQYGRCTNIGNCPKADTGETIELPEGTDFACPECESELMAVESKGGGSLPSIPKPVLLSVLALLLLAGVGYAGFTIFSNDDAAAADEQQPASAQPDLQMVRSALQEDLDGYVLESGPTFSTREDQRFTYDIALRPEDQRYEVPVTDFKPPEGWDEAARDMASQLVFSEALPAGKVYAAEKKSARSESADRIEAQWTGRFKAVGGAWQFAGDGLLDAQAPREDDAGTAGETLLTETALEEAERAQVEATQQFEQRWEALEQRVEQHRQSLSANLPPPCTKDTEPLIREITELSTNECPRMQDRAERKQCYLKVQELNSKLGDCETRNQVRKEARRGLRGKVDRYRQEQIDELRAELEQTAADHDGTTG